MIIQLDSATPASIETARRSLQALASNWGYQLTEPPARAAASEGTTQPGDGKAIDPVALATLLVSIPSAALAVFDLADRIGKRRRAHALIGHAQQLTTQQVNVTVITGTRIAELSALTPDQLLDLAASEDPDN